MPLHPCPIAFSAARTVLLEAAKEQPGATKDINQAALHLLSQADRESLQHTCYRSRLNSGRSKRQVSTVCLVSLTRRKIIINPH